MRWSSNILTSHVLGISIRIGMVKLDYLDRAGYYKPISSLWLGGLSATAQIQVLRHTFTIHLLLVNKF